MRPFTIIPFSAGLLLLAAAVAAPAAEQAPADDACLAAVRAGAIDADRTCSDLIAGLRYDGAAVSNAPALAAALNNQALARMRTGDLEGAAADLTEALDLAPAAWALYLNRATLALMNGDAGAALNDLGRVKELTPAGSAAAAAADRNSVLAWRMLGNLDAAEVLLAQARAQEQGGALSSRRPAPAVPVRPPG